MAEKESKPVQMSQEQFLTLLESLQTSFAQQMDHVVRRTASSAEPREIPTPKGNFARCTSRFTGSKTDDVDAFISSITVYKDCANVTDENALLGLPMLLEGQVATWYQGVKSTVKDWDEAVKLLRSTYGSSKPAFRIYKEIFAEEQGTAEKTDLFICNKRALFAQIASPPTEEMQLDMIYGLLHRKIREFVPRSDVNSYDELLRKARAREESLEEILPVDNDSEKKISVVRCKVCRKRGHTEAECFKKKGLASASSENTTPKVAPTPSQPMSHTHSRPEISCYGCGKSGFIRSNCPDCKAKKKQDGDRETTQTSSLEFYTVQTTPKSEGCPYVQIEIEEMQGLACIDSGARQSVASHLLYRKLLQKGYEFKEVIYDVTLADGISRSMDVLMTNLVVRLEGHDTPLTVLVFKQCKNTRTLLGVDFLEKSGMVINMRQREWFYDFEPDKRYRFSQKVSAHVPMNSLFIGTVELRGNEGLSLNSDQKERLTALLRRNDKVFEDNHEATPYAEHRIIVDETKGPISSPPYRMSPPKRDLLQCEINKMLTDHVIEECESPWASPVVLVDKPDGSVRVCVDFRRLNEITVPDSYPLPRIDDLLHLARKSAVMSTIDLRAGYWQVKVRPADGDKTAMITPFGLYRFLRLPFGLRNAPMTFQRLIDKFKTGLPDVCLLAYLDDIIVISASFDDHLLDLEKVFARLEQFRLNAKREKCQFACDKVKYLGHFITPEGLSVDPDKTTAIQQIPPPTNVKQLQSFLQTCAWYRRFIDGFAEISRPLSNLTKKNTAWRWTTTEMDAFDKLKWLLTSPPLLQQADPTKPYILRTDASNYALGAVLSQGDDGEEKPIEFASRLLTSPERNYTTTEREALAMVWAFGKFRGYIEASPVKIKTDHQPLKWLFSLKSPTGRLARWSLLLQPYDIQIEYVPGKLNKVADTLSRPWCETHSVLSHCEMCTVTIELPVRSANDIRAEQLKDEEVKKIIGAFEDDDVRARQWSDHGYVMNQGVLYRYSPESESEDVQLVVPCHERPRILREFHDSDLAGHNGVERTISRISRRYYWTGMRKYIADYVKHCVACQRYKPSNLKPAGLLQTPAFERRFEAISVDLFGPLPETDKGEQWIFIIEDTTSGWVELFALKQATAEECARVLLDEIFLRFGFPRKVNSDNGVQFVSKLMQHVMHCLDVSQKLIPVYDAKANGMVERKNRDLKVQLAILLGNKHSDWSEKLPSVRFALNTGKCQSTGYSAAYLTFGRELRTPDDVSHDLRANISAESFVPEVTPYLLKMVDTLRAARDVHDDQQRRHKVYADQRRRDVSDYSPGDKVWVATHLVSDQAARRTSKFIPRRDGPYLILRKVSDSSYEIASLEAPEKSLGKYSVSDLTPYFGPEKDPEPIYPIRKRGRPRKQ